MIYAPKTFSPFLKLCIGLITGLIAHRIGKINDSTDRKHVFKWTLLASAGGLLFNAVMDPLVGYFYKLVIIGKPAAEVALTWNVASTSINCGALCDRLGCALYSAAPALQKAGLFFQHKPAHVS